MVSTVVGIARSMCVEGRKYSIKFVDLPEGSTIERTVVKGYKRSSIDLIFLLNDQF